LRVPIGIHDQRVPDTLIQDVFVNTDVALVNIDELSQIDVSDTFVKAVRYVFGSLISATSIADAHVRIAVFIPTEGDGVVQGDTVVSGVYT
jgi:hypothetical protein